MNETIRQRLEEGKRRIGKRLQVLIGGTSPRVEGEPEFTRQRPVYEMAERSRAIPYGGIGAIHQLVRSLGLAQRIDERLRVLKQPKPYQDSDHILNIAYNLLCGGRYSTTSRCVATMRPSSTLWVRERFRIPPRPATTADGSTRQRSGG